MKHSVRDEGVAIRPKEESFRSKEVTFVAAGRSRPHGRCLHRHPARPLH